MFAPTPHRRPRLKSQPQCCQRLTSAPPMGATLAFRNALLLSCTFPHCSWPILALGPVATPPLPVGDPRRPSPAPAGPAPCRRSQAHSATTRATASLRSYFTTGPTRWRLLYPERRLCLCWLFWWCLLCFWL